MEQTETAAGDGENRHRPGSRWVGALLWVVAITVMLAAAIYQRRTGPTYPFRGDLVVAGDTTSFALIRSEETVRDAVVRVPVPARAEVEGTLVYRRFPTDDAFTTVALGLVAESDGAAGATASGTGSSDADLGADPSADAAGAASRADTLTAALPAQPAAGKLEYRVELETPAGVVRIPGDYTDAAGADGDQTVIIRYKDPVPAVALVPHVLFMFFAILVGVRSGLAAAIGRTDYRRYAWTALGLMTVGGMILGPIVQKHAFGKFWTGWPNGYDLTDNKTLIMWLVWLLACAVLGLARTTRARERAGRGAVALATLVMLVVYLVPHSFRGSELDYGRLDEGADPAEAIETGR